MDPDSTQLVLETETRPLHTRRLERKIVETLLCRLRSLEGIVADQYDDDLNIIMEIQALHDEVTFDVSTKAAKLEECFRVLFGLPMLAYILPETAQP